MQTLFEQTKIKSMTLPNRFVRSATWLALAAPGGACTGQLLERYRESAEGGVGLIISGFAFVSREGQGPVGQLGIHNDDMLPGLKQIVETVHAAGARIAAQIVHCGNQSQPENNDGGPVLGPSSTFDKDGQPVARALTTTEIKRITEDFATAAARAQAVGFDAVQLHYAHGYLGSQFLCPRYNTRTDEYGGSLSNRSRFLHEVYEQVRQAVGPDYPVMAKLNLEDYFDDGLTGEEGIRVAVSLADLGLDALEISGGMSDSGNLGPARRNISTQDMEAYFLANATAVKEKTGMPVILVGGLRTPARMAEIHQEHGIDCFALSRPLIRQPDLINQWRAGRTTAADCVSCSMCFLTVKKGKGIYCPRAE